MNEGLQQYYYPDGLPKTLLHYVEGKLDGEVLLYHHTGALARKLYFDHGKRTGKEQIWNEYGKPLVEANYVDDLPVGVSRQWHPNGVLAAEIVYDESSKRVETLMWNFEGRLLRPEEHKSVDYFDMISNQMGKVTTSIDGMLKELTKTLPLVETHLQKLGGQMAASDLKLAKSDALTEELQKLQNEMVRLQGLSEKLQGKTGGDEKNPKEDLWKTPLAKQEIEHHLEKLHEQMTKELNTVQQVLFGMIKKIRSKKDTDKNA